MIKWPVTYTNYNDETITEDFYFNLNKAELTQMNFDVNGAYSQFIERIANQRDLKLLGEEFKNLILRSYGEKSDDGRLFRKTQQMRDDFQNTEAFSVLYMELIMDENKAARFIKGILPKDLRGAPVPENHSK